MVFSSNEIGIAINTGTIATPVWTPLIECTGIGKTTDVNVDERDTYGDPHTKRTATGGIKHDFSFEAKLTPGDAGSDFLRDIVFGGDVRKYNDNQIQLTFPLADETNSTPRTETYTGVIKPTADGGQAALDLAVLNFDFMSSKGVDVVKEAA